MTLQLPPHEPQHPRHPPQLHLTTLHPHLHDWNLPRQHPLLPPLPPPQARQTSRTNRRRSQRRTNPVSGPNGANTVRARAKAARVNDHSEDSDAAVPQQLGQDRNYVFADCGGGDDGFGAGGDDGYEYGESG